MIFAALTFAVVLVQGLVALPTENAAAASASSLFDTFEAVLDQHLPEYRPQGLQSAIESVKDAVRGVDEYADELSALLERDVAAPDDDALGLIRYAEVDASDAQPLVDALQGLRPQVTASVTDLSCLKSYRAALDALGWRCSKQRLRTLLARVRVLGSALHSLGTVLKRRQSKWPVIQMTFALWAWAETQSARHFDLLQKTIAHQYAYVRAASDLALAGVRPQAGGAEIADDIAWHIWHRADALHRVYWCNLTGVEASSYRTAFLERFPWLRAVPPSLSHQLVAPRSPFGMTDANSRDGSPSSSSEGPQQSVESDSNSSSRTWQTASDSSPPLTP